MRYFPISSWGAYLIGLISIIFGGAAVSHSHSVYFNGTDEFCVVHAILVFFFVWTNIDLFSMKKHERLDREGTVI